MDTFNWLLLASLTGCAGVASLALSLRFEAQSRPETALVALLFFWGLIVLPIFALGYTGFLYRTPVALLSGCASAAIIGTSALRRGPKQYYCELKGALAGLFRLVPDGIRICFRGKGVSLFGALTALGIVAFTVLLTYLLPADESWDGLYYHQPIVGFALQNHGFALVELPNTLLAQTINGYPRFGEAFSIWFVIFTDKTLIELPASLAAPGLMLASYLLARRYTRDRAACIGWGAVILLMPAIYSQLRTTMIDVQLWFFYLGAAHLVTKPAFRMRDAALGLVAASYVVGTKGTGLLLVAPLVVIAVSRALWERREKRTLLPLLPGLTLVTTIAALTLVRNFRAFHDPIWPISYSSRALGLVFKGLATLQQVAPDPSARATLAQMYAPPAGGVHDIIVRGYGSAVPWVVLPLGALGLSLCVVVAGLGVIRRTRDHTAENLLLVAFAALLPFAASPSFSNARYNVQAVVAAVLGVAWLGGRGKARLQEGAVAASLVLSIVSLSWTGYLWGLGLRWKDIGALAMRSKAERRSLNFSTFQMPATVAKLREAELGPGDVAAFTSELSFIGVLWNDKFSNRVIYLGPTRSAALLGELDRLHARWVAVGEQSAARRVLDGSPKYELVGVAARQDKTVIFRRRPRPI